MKTLEQYLAQDYARHVIDHDIRANVDDAGKVTFYIHPRGVDGETLDFVVDGNTLLPMHAPARQGITPASLVNCGFFLVASAASIAAVVGYFGWKMGCIALAFWACIGCSSIEEREKASKQS